MTTPAQLRRLALGVALAALPLDAAALAVATTAPTVNANNVARNTAIVIDFDAPLQTASVTASSFRVWGRSGGVMTGAIVFANGNQRLTFTPVRAFFPGEQVMVQLASSIAGSDASTLRVGGYAFQFVTRAGVAPMFFEKIDTVSVRTTSASTRLYGGAFPDLNNDGWIDYVAVNEVSADLRVLLNRADGSGLVTPVIVPPTAIGSEASPNEAVDFNNDGRIDVATSNTSSHSVSIVLGNGNGTFAPQQAVPVGNSPHGLAALDVDGDADLDLVVANQGANNLSRLLNNGSGVFGPATNFDSGGSGEYSLAAGDMNNDGLVDLVVGTRNDQQIHVMQANGDGTFTRVSNPAAGGLTWMIALGDVNNDGDLDVSSVNSTSNNGSILLGNGDGTLQAAVITAFGGHMVATDLGDLDGDGDLDWVASSFGASRWYVLRNNGSGAFTAIAEIPADANASCASLYDFDNDGDLDMALADEIDDVVLLMSNGNNTVFRDGFETP